MERFNLNKLNDMNSKNSIRVESHIALEKLDGNDVDISRAWKTVKENIRTSATESVGYYELKQHNPWFDECPKLLYQRKQGKLQWLQSPRQTNGDNLNNVRHETSQTFRNKRERISERKN
jgi:hypothetical protein